MKAVISSTFDNIYLYNLPVVSWAWNKLGVEVICFQPYLAMNENYSQPTALSIQTSGEVAKISFHQYRCRADKAATYAQCSRLYGGALYDLPNDEILITSDADMLPFHPLLDLISPGQFNLIGCDLVPEGQFAMCYAAGTVEQWRDVMKVGGRSYQQCLDDLLGHIEAESFRGNYWGKDQETLFNQVEEAKSQSGANIPIWPIERARPGTQFADHRLDRTDSFLLDRLSPSIVDFHLPRPLWTDENHAILMTVLKYYWPNEDFGWWESYREAYLKLM